MSWQTLTTDDVLQEFNSSEKSAFDAVKGDDSLAGIVTRVVDEFRDAAIASAQPVGEDGTMPRGLMSHAVALARWRFLLSLPQNQRLQSADRKTAAQKAEAILDAIAAGDRKVEHPDGSTPSLALPSLETRTRNFTDDTQDGI